MSVERVELAACYQRDGGQDRTHFDAAELAELAASIEQHGCLQRPIVRTVEGRPGFEIVAGERRIRAMRDVLGWETAELDVREGMTDREAAGAMLVENVVRADLDPVAEGRAYADRIARFDMTPAAVAEECGIPATRVRARLRLLELSDHVLHYVESRQLPLGHAGAMVGLDANRQALALRAYHEGPLSLAVFQRLCGRLLDDQAAEDAEGMFSADAFLQVEEWAREADELVRAETAPAVELVRDEVAGVDDAARLLGITPAQLRAMVRREAFPAADLHVDRRPAWYRSTITEWAEAEGRGLAVTLDAVAS